MHERNRVPKPLSRHEQLALLKQPNPRAPTGLRNLCIINIMLKTGMRVNEIINLKEKDIDFELGRIYIAESGAARSRTLFLDQADLLLLKSWSDLRPDSGKFFFTTLEGTRLKDRYIREMVKRLAKKSGITKDVYPHLLRYTFAVDFINEMKDIKLLQEALGHRELSATQLYTRLLFENSNQPDEDSTGAATRSGTPLIRENQESFIFNSQEKQTEVVREASEKISASQTKPENNNHQDKQVNTIQKNNAAATGSSKTEKVSAAGQEQFKKPEITVMPEEYLQKEKKRIPAIKCCRCNFIIHYQADCPQCGTPLVETLRHWGKIV